MKIHLNCEEVAELSVLLNDLTFYLLFLIDQDRVMDRVGV